MRHLAGLLAAALCLPGILAVAGAAADDEGPTCSTSADGTRVAAAPFATGTIVDLIAEPDQPGRLWVTDGTTIRRSDDLGCNWTDTFALQETISTAGNRIVDLASPSGDPDWISGLVMEPNPALPGQVALTVVTTRDSGNEWIVIDEGLPDNVSMEVPQRCERTCGMVGTTDRDDALYLWFTEPSGVSVYWSISGGRTYTVRSEPANPLQFDVRTQEPAEEMVTDDPGYLGLFGTREQVGATASDDGGRTWNTWPEHFRNFSGQRFGFPDETVGRAADRQVDRLLVAELDAGGRLAATHAKFTDVLGWHRAPTDDVDGVVTGLTSLGDASILAVQTTDGVWVGEQVTLSEVVWRPLFAAKDLHGLQFAGDRLWVHDGTSIRGLDADVLPRLLDLPPVPVPPSELDLPPFDPANPIGKLPGTLLGPADVVVRPGEPIRVPLTLDVPATLPSIDLFFLIARHDSMQDDLDTLTREIMFVVTDLVAAGVDVNVGVGVHGSQVRYHRYRDIGPPNDEFKAILGDIYGFGAVSAAYTAIDAAMSGTIYPQTASMFATYKGLQTHWRPNTTRVVVHVTDVNPQTDDELKDEEGATIAEAHEALVEVGALHLGLFSGDGGTSLTVQIPQRLKDLSRVSGALAVNPVDCNGDGVVDIPAGDPIVCFVPAGGTNEAISDLGLLSGFGDVIVDLLGEATNLTPLTWHTTTPSLVTSFAPDIPTDRIDLLAPTVLAATATVTCTADLAGTVTTTRLSAASGTRGLATTTLDIQCGDLPLPPPATVAVAPVVPAEDSVPAEVVGVTSVPAVPAAAPVPVANAPASSNVFPNQGMASVEQREEQHQAATIGKDRGQEDPEAELAFSAVRHRDTSPAATLALAALMTAGASGALVRRRQQAGRPQALPMTTSRNSRG